MKIKVLFTIIALLITSFCIAQITFEERTLFNEDVIANLAHSVYAADIDNDGDMDILSASSVDDKIAWYENLDGLGQFSDLKIISTIAVRAESVFAIDIDGDGDVDVLSASKNDDKIAWYENLDGLGSFGPQLVISYLTDGATSVFAIDIDNDGDSDVLSASSSDDKIAWYENLDGFGDFGDQQIITEFADFASSVYAADLDGDGDIDVLSASRNDDKIAWYENLDGFGDFGTQQIISLNANVANSVHATDLDGDGDMDILSASILDDKIAWYENVNGLGEFGSQQLISNATNGASSVYAEDIDGDGDMDILSTSKDDNRVSWFKNEDGEGSFGSQQIISNNAKSAIAVYAKDINNDGAVDVIAASTTDDKIMWFENQDGLGDFGVDQFLSHEVNHISDIYPANIDGDGNMDVFIAANSLLAWAKIDKEGNFFQNQFNLMPFVAISASIFPCDLDEDGDIDLINGLLSDGDIIWYENLDGQGTFGDPQLITSEADNPYGLFAADVDGDGDLDVLSASNAVNRVAWYENLDGQGNFGVQQIISNEAFGAFSVHAADIDGDEDVDVAYASNTQDKIAWYENLDGQGTFGEEIVITDDEIDTWLVSLNDFDGDGFPDVLASSRNEQPVLWFQNDGNGNFGVSQLITDSGRTALPSDIDNDGDFDILVRSATGNQRKIVWFENTDNSIGFGAEQLIFEGASDLIKAMDMNNDNKTDIISSYDDGNDPSELILFENLGLSTNEINGVVSFDTDGNDCNNNNYPFSNLMITTESEFEIFSTFTLSNGFYQLFLNEGSYITYGNINLPQYFNSTPNSYTTDFVGSGNTDVLNFCISSTSTVNDVNVTIYPSINEPRPGFGTTYRLVYKNIGTTQLSGNLTFEFDNIKLQFLSASETVSSQTSNTLTFDYADLNPFETRIIDLEFNVFAPPTTEIDDVLVATATINPISGDETQDDNVFELEQVVIGSYDPNDIQVLEGEEILYEDRDKYLHYLIRFQNTGTAGAINVNVENVLDDKLDWTTMQLESLSHEGRVEILNGSDVKFIFDNINLPDSTNDEPNSHGFIAYKIKPKNDVEIGDVIFNTADIFFDFNPPIITNTVSTEIVDALGITNFSAANFSLYPNPANTQVMVVSNKTIDKVALYDINGRLLKSLVIDSPKNEISMPIEELSSGLYFIEANSGAIKSSLKFIKN